MIIRCPKCDFEKFFADQTIPSSAVMATCPKCGTKFNFREQIEQKKDVQTAPSHEIGVSSQSSDFGNSAGSAVAADVRGELPKGKSPKPIDERPNTESRTSEKTNSDKNTGDFTEAKPSFEYPDEAQQGTSTGRAFIPWEVFEKFGFIQAWLATVLYVLFRPTQLFGAVRYYLYKSMRPVYFFILLGMIKLGAEFFWMRQLADIITDPQGQQMLSAVDKSVGLTLLIAPALLFFQLYLYSGIFYLMLRLVRPDRVQWQAVLRVLAYAAAADIFYLVPFVGNVIAPLWYALAVFIGIKHALDISWKNTALALIPPYLIALSIQVQVLMQMNGGLVGQ